MAGNGNKKSVLFICLGNICRSPIAEAVFKHVVKEHSNEEWVVDSAAIGAWHVGDLPDSRARKVMQSKGIEMKHCARQITKSDFNTFDYIFGMDESNMEELNSLAPKQHKAKLELLGSYDPEGEVIIRDPYYDRGDAGFVKCYEQCLRCCEGFVKSLK